MSKLQEELQVPYSVFWNNRWITMCENCLEKAKQLYSLSLEAFNFFPVTLAENYDRLENIFIILEGRNDERDDGQRQPSRCRWVHSMKSDENRHHSLTRSTSPQKGH